MIIENGISLLPIEIKSGQTIQAEYLKGIQYWNKLTQQSTGFVIYGGKEAQKRSNGISILPVSEVSEITV